MKNKELYIGFLLLSLPIFLFLKPQNLSLLSFSEVFIILLSHIIFILLFFVFSLIFYLTFYKKKNENFSNIFLILCFGFYTLYFYDPIYKILSILGIKSYIFYITNFILLFLYLLIFIFFVSKNSFKIFFFRFILIFSFLIILIFIFNNINYNFKKNTTQLISKNNNSINDEIDYFITNNKKNNNNFNIYYIILDEMIGLKNAEIANIILKDKEIRKLKTKKLKIIEPSFSTYKSTYLTLASIMNLEYPVDETKQIYKNHKMFYPIMMETNRINLLQILSNLKYEFNWAGNYLMPCRVNKYNKINCISSNLSLINSLLINGIYYGTPIPKIFNSIVYKFEEKNLSGQRNLSSFIKYLEKNKTKDSNSFYFIHQLSPHSPFLVNEDCSKVDKYYFKEEINGYSNSYKCVLKEINNFLEYIKIKDPKSIVVIQADHGIDTIFGDLNQSLRFKYKASIFNSVMAPNECFEDNFILNNNINTIRWAINCISELKLKNVPTFHYRYDDEDKYMQKLEFK